MNHKGNIIGVDLGGTSIHSGKVENGKVVQSVKVDTPAKGNEKEVIEALYSTIEKCFDVETQSIGIGVPSVVDTQKGIVYDVMNIPAWKEVPLQEMLFNKFKVPVSINNDSNCFVAGEKIYGKGKAYQNIVGMTLGTGLGLGLLMNGKLYEGRNCGAGEFGMLPYLNDVYETYCSGRFFSKVKKVDAKELSQRAMLGDPVAEELFAEFGRHLGKVVKSILYAYDPDIIIMGGSLSKAFNYFHKAMYKEMADFFYEKSLQNLRIEISEMTDSAILGAAALHTHILSSSKN